MGKATPTLEQAFGEVVRGLRQGLGLSQEKLAQRAGLSMVYVSEIERGKRAPSLPVVFKLAVGLGISAAKLVQQVEQRMRA